MCVLVSETFCHGSSDVIVANEITLCGAVKDPLRCLIINVDVKVCFGAPACSLAQRKSCTVTTLIEGGIIFPGKNGCATMKRFCM